jgi:hypothetical protein
MSLGERVGLLILRRCVSFDMEKAIYKLQEGSIKKGPMHKTSKLS